MRKKQITQLLRNTTNLLISQKLLPPYLFFYEEKEIVYGIENHIKDFCLFFCADNSWFSIGCSRARSFSTKINKTFLSCLAEGKLPCHSTSQPKGQLKSDLLKTIQNYKLGFLRPFLVIFPQLHNHLSQNLGFYSHFEGPNMSES